ncbi:hypothetical protein [Hymenobacter negativus]|uniref:Helix-turn-helix domain-containing protein n=1 Tax=Hymenobacter negativus TaxID=2795026 RepID=A0ABS3QD81_9BACT|nr:hypothetical protein [Hymenobacter negativus]MBO2009194.1 hypothetical protein [Hymenobacter negativus]
MQYSLDFSRPRRPYQYHSCALVNRLRELRPNHTAGQLATLLGLRSARHVRDLCATYGIRKRRP